MNEFVEGFSYIAPYIAPSVLGMLVCFTIVFLVLFFFPALMLRGKLSTLTKQVGEVKDAGLARVSIDDAGLRHLWQQFVETLHRVHDVQGGGAAVREHYRATVPAEVIFNAAVVIEGRLKTEFFKHLPGLMTGLGIIATFAGLINGLKSAALPGGQLDTGHLIGTVGEAFVVSAFAIALAMVVTFLEKGLLSGLHRKLEDLCRQIDSLYSAGVGEEYLSRLVNSSEESTAQAKILKDALVGDLRAILERLTEQQIAASAAQQTTFERNLISAIDRGLSAPLGQIANGLVQTQTNQGAAFTQSLQDSMAAFAEKLDQLLGGQVGQARELQQETVRALQGAAETFRGLAQEVGQAGSAATAAMSVELEKVLASMATGQRQLGDTMRTVADELRSAAARAQAETATGMHSMMAQLGQQLNGALQVVQEQSTATSAVHAEQLGTLSSSTQSVVAELTESVRSQTIAVEHATTAMRGAVADLGTSVERNVTLIGHGADQMRKAAERFSTTGGAIADVFDRAQSVSVELSQAASRLSQSSQDVEAVIRDYKAAREVFESIVDCLRGTVDTAKREVAMTSDLVTRLEAAAQKLVAAQGHADDYLAKLNGVLAEAHSTFSMQMLQTVRKGNGDFHDSLSKATGLLANTIAEFEQALGDNRPDPRRGRAA